MEKRCSECGEHKPASHFYKNRTNKDGLFGKCKVCSEGTKKERALNEVTVDSKVCFHLLLTSHGIFEHSLFGDMICEGPIFESDIIATIFLIVLAMLLTDIHYT